MCIIAVKENSDKKFLEINPVAYEKLFEERKIQTLDELKDFKIESEMPDKYSVLMPSPIYKNKLYPIEQFDELYKKDLDEAIYNLACRMGVSSYKSSFKYYKKEVKKKNFLEKLKIWQGQNEGDFVFKVLDKCATTEEKERNFSDTEKGILHFSKEELEEFIEKEGINTDNLPVEFKDKVKLYLQGKDIQSNFIVDGMKCEGYEKSFDLVCKIMLNFYNQQGNAVAKHFIGFTQKTSYKCFQTMKLEIKFEKKE